MKIDAILMQMSATAAPLSTGDSTQQAEFAAVLQQAARQHGGHRDDAATAPLFNTLAADDLDLRADSWPPAMLQLAALTPEPTVSNAEAPATALRNLTDQDLAELQALVDHARADPAIMNALAEQAEAVSATTGAGPLAIDNTASLPAIAALAMHALEQQNGRQPVENGRNQPRTELLSTLSSLSTDLLQQAPRNTDISLQRDTGLAFPGHLQAAPGEQALSFGQQQPAMGAPLQSDALQTGQNPAGLAAALTGLGASGNSGQAAATGMPQTVFSTPVQSPDWGRDFGQQLVRMAQTGPQQMTLQLHPQELGPLSVDLKISDQVAQLSLLSASTQVRGVLEQALPMLRDALAEQGITLEDTHIGEQRDPRGDQQAFGQEPRQQSAAQGDELLEADELALRTEAATRALEAGRINLYV